MLIVDAQQLSLKETHTAWAIACVWQFRIEISKKSKKKKKILFFLDLIEWDFFSLQLYCAIADRWNFGFSLQLHSDKVDKNKSLYLGCKIFCFNICQHREMITQLDCLIHLSPHIVASFTMCGENISDLMMAIPCIQCSIITTITVLHIRSLDLFIL